MPTEHGDNINRAIKFPLSSIKFPEIIKKFSQQCHIFLFLGISYDLMIFLNFINMLLDPTTEAIKLKLESLVWFCRQCGQKANYLISRTHTSIKFKKYLKNVQQPI